MPYQVFGSRSGAVAVTVMCTRSASARSSGAIFSIASRTACRPSAFLAPFLPSARSSAARAFMAARSAAEKPSAVFVGMINDPFGRCWGPGVARAVDQDVRPDLSPRASRFLTTNRMRADWPRSEVGDVRLLGPDRLRGLLQTGQLRLGEVALDDLLDAFAADLGLDAEVHTVDAVLAVDPGTHRDDRTRVLDDGLGHAGGGGRRRVVRGAGLQQRDDLGPAVAGAGDELLDGRSVHDIGERLAVDEAGRRDRHHRVAVRAERQRLHR